MLTRCLLCELEQAKQLCEITRSSRLHLAMAEVERDQSSWVRFTQFD